MYLAMPEEHLGWRGHFAAHKNETSEETAARKIAWNNKQKYLEEWKSRFLALGEKKEEFIGYIGDNNYSVERYLEIKDPELKKLFIHYFTMPVLLKALSIEDRNEKCIISKYITDEFPLMYQQMVEYVANSRIPYSMLEGAFRTFGAKFAHSVLELIDYEAEEPFVINNLIKVQKKAKLNVFKFEYIRSYYLYKSVEALTKKEKKEIVVAIKSLDEQTTQSILSQNFRKFKRNLIKQASENEVGAQYIAEQIEQQLDDFCRQISLFEGM